MNRRRALLAASMRSGGGEFYCELWKYSPSGGVYFHSRTATFIIPMQMTWSDAVGLVDTEERTEIISVQMPSGTRVISLKNLKKQDGNANFYPEDSISISNNIEIGKTYKFMEE